MANPDRAPDDLHHEPASVAYARNKAGLTQLQLAELVGCTQPHISEIESGTRNAPPRLLLKIAEATNCPVVFLERKREVAS